MKNIQTNRDLAIRIFKILYARSDGTPEGILSEFHKAFVKSKQLSNQDFKEAEHPRDNAGKFTDKGEGKSVTLPREVQAKIDSVKIDFTRDNILPELNPEDLEEVGFKISKPVLLKKTVIERNTEDRHKDIKKEKEFNKIIGKCLYAPELIFRGNNEKPYFNLITRLGENKSSVVLLEITELKECFEIVHLHHLTDESRTRLEKKRNS